MNSSSMVNAVGRLGGPVALAKTGALTVALFLLFPPTLLEGRYSPLEVGLGLLAVNLIPDRAPVVHQKLSAPTAFVFLVALMIASTVWSAVSWDSLRDGVSYGVLALAALLLVRSLSIGQIAGGIAMMGVGALILSCLVAAFKPDISIDSWNLLQGIYGNRNGLGYVLAQAFPAALAVPLRFQFGWLLRLGILAFLSFGIIASGSRTALIASALVLGAWVAMVLIRRWRLASIGVAAVVALVATLAVVNLERVLQLLGKDSSGSGRTEIWAALGPVIRENVLLGTGWARSWPVGSPQYEAMIAEFARPFFHAHNEVLNWLVTLGVVGLVLVIAVFGFIAWGGWSVWADRIPGGSFVLLTLVMIIARGLTEISETSAQGWLTLSLIAALSAQHLASRSRHIPRLVLLQSRKPDRHAKVADSEA